MFSCVFILSLCVVNHFPGINAGPAVGRDDLADGTYAVISTTHTSIMHTTQQLSIAYMCYTSVITPYKSVTNRVSICCFSGANVGRDDDAARASGWRECRAQGKPFLPASLPACLPASLPPKPQTRSPQPYSPNLKTSPLTSHPSPLNLKPSSTTPKCYTLNPQRSTRMRRPDTPRSSPLRNTPTSI